MPENMLPRLPQGDSSLISALSQSLSFHSSPESFISTRARNTAALHSSNAAGKEETASQIPTVVRARILNRNVAVVSSHRLCEDILRVGNGEPQKTVTAITMGEMIGPNTFAIRPAYHELMSDFFPPPNILLLDSPDHAAKRKAWDEQLSSIPSETSIEVQEIVDDHIKSWPSESTIDLYESMKDLSWRVLLCIFLQLRLTDKKYSLVESLQEKLLRGQFSLFPVSIHTPFWRSPRSKAIEARRELQKLLKDHISQQDKGCPFLQKGKIDEDELASNAILFTSSIAVKALASLLTASLLNLFLLPCEPTLASRVRKEGSQNGQILLSSILLETERLSPPVVGIMRRAQQDVILAAPEGQPPILVPAGWDVWLYCVSAGRDPAAYELADTFLPERFISANETRDNFAFGGSGPKVCLGRGVIRHIISTVATKIVDADIRLEGSVAAEGVRGWLGWDSGVGVDAFARDLKQLPCQRPKEAIRILVHRGRG